MAHSSGYKLLRAALWTILFLVVLAIALPAMLYIPPVQDFVKDIALKEVKKSTGLDISISYLRLKFPLNVQLHDVVIIEASGDTMASVGTAGVDVKFFPLLHGDIDVKGTQLSDVRYNLGTPDSAMFLTAHVRQFEASGAGMNFAKGKINVSKASLDGADVKLVIKDTIMNEKADTAAVSPLIIHAGDIQLSNIRYTMSMLPVIDSLSTEIPFAHLIGGTVDMGKNKIHAQYLKIDSVRATYLTPSANYPASYQPADSANSNIAATPWTVTADSLRLTAKRALYAMRNAQPGQGLDMNYLQVSDVTIAVDSFYNRGTDITVPLKQLAATERCGVSLKAQGTFAMDSAAIRAKQFRISTLFSKLSFDAMMGTGSPISDPDLPLWIQANGNIGLADIEQIMPLAKPILRDVPRSNGLQLSADINGTASYLTVNNISISLPRYLKLMAKGGISNPMNPKKIGGKVYLNGTLSNVNFLKSSFLDKSTAKQLNIPPMRLNGNITYSPEGAAGKLAAFTSGGKLAFNGKWQQKAQGYNARLTLDNFPIHAFMPSLGFGNITADVIVDGKGYNPASPSTTVHAYAEISDIEYLSKHYGNTILDATLADGNMSGTLDSHNPDADLAADFTARITDSLYSWNLNGNINHLDLQALGISATPMYGSMTIDTKGDFNPRRMGMDAEVSVNRVNWTIDRQKLLAENIQLNVLTNDTLSHATLSTGDLNAIITAYAPLDSNISRISELAEVIDTVIAKRNLDVKAVQKSLPPLDLSLTAGTNNLAAEFLTASGINFSKATLSLHNDSLMSLHAKTFGLSTTAIKTDTVAIDALQHGKYLVYTVTVNNRPGTMDDFAHVKLRGFMADDKLSFIIRQRNIHDKQGFFIGVTAAITDSAAKISFVPHRPTIGYKEWMLNPDNFVSYNFYTHRLNANLQLENGKSLVHLYTESPADSVRAGAPDDVVLNLKNIHIQDWLTISPFAPPLKGDLGADMRFRWDSRQLTGNGMLNLTDLYYGRDRVGNFNVDLSLFNDKSGLLKADAALMVDSIKVITARGVLNDSTAASPFLLDFSMIHFPLRIANPFLPKGTATLSGMINGRMDISGSMSDPVFNGYLDFDSTAIKLALTGATYRFSENKIPVDSSIVKFNNFTISGLNNNPLYIDGTVNARSISNPDINLHLKANDMQLVNSNRPRGADVYGKAFIDLDAKVAGNISFLRINANLNLLPGTNVTYVMSSSGQSAITSRSSGKMVTFVQFSDTAKTITADTVPASSMAMFLDANIAISAGSTINVDISSDGKNKASLQPEGNLTYTLTPMNADGRLTGRINIDNGFVRYTPPFMSEKNFSFSEGSYVVFNGNILNPRLNIHATDEIKANVTQEGQDSRLVNFDVGVAVTNTLQNMDVAFDLSTNDDLTIQNELQGMSPEQRANQAMNMLLYNVYTGPGTKANASLSGNPLYSFLTSRLNSWTANNIKGVDISFGIDQYDKTTAGTTSTATSYSYKVSKTLFNDRFKIVVGGNYTTDADTDENMAENLVNDVAVEYLLNRSGSIYVRVFRHTEFESILEGEITQTGVGFVLKRKINSFGDIFRRQRNSSATQQ